jgi:RNA polymerase sigma factor (sigma-70 family)
MNEKCDVQLLREYAQAGNETAFREIVSRHTDLIYSSASRQTTSPDLAQDIAQKVFTDLARKAQSIAESLDHDASLLGWLFRSTRFEALKQLRDNRRRGVRETQFMEIIDPASGMAPEWEQICSVLDGAIADLNERDRDALLLRFFKNQDFRTIGETFGVSEDAAQKRVSRALDRLRAEFARQGVTTTAMVLATVLSANAVTQSPAGLASLLATAALSGATMAPLAAAPLTKAIAMTFLQKAFVAAVFVVVISAGLFVLNSTPGIANDKSVLIEGTYSEKSMSHIPSFDMMQKESQGVFQVYLQKERWIIKYLNFSALTNAELLNSGEVASCDGTNVYVIRLINPAKIARDKEETSNANAYFKLSSEICQGTYPPPLDPFIHNLWLAMLSGTVLTNSVGTTKPLIGGDFSMYYNTNFVWNYSWISTAGNNNQRKLVLHSNTNGTWFQRDLKNRGKLGFLRLGSPYEQGLEVGVADWLEETNLGGFSFPVKYSLSTFLPTYPPMTAGTPGPWYVFNCVVTNAVIVRAQPVPVPPDDETTVVDHRFTEKGYPNVNYMITNRAWPTAEGKRWTGVLQKSRKESLEAASLRELGIEPASP